MDDLHERLDQIAASMEDWTFTATEERTYRQEFMDFSSEQEFADPETGKPCPFGSLPKRERKRIHSEWAEGRGEGEDAEPEMPEPQAEPPPPGAPEEPQEVVVVEEIAEEVPESEGRILPDIWSDADVWREDDEVPSRGLAWQMHEELDERGIDGYEDRREYLMDRLTGEGGPFDGAKRGDDGWGGAGEWEERIQSYIDDEIEHEDDPEDVREASMESWTFARKTGAYSEHFMKRVEGMKFRHPETGNQVQFQSLPTNEQARYYAMYEKARATRETAEPAPPEKAKPKKPKRPTFAKARDAVFPALEEDGWKVKPGLKVPKAEKEIDGNRVILHFKPQAVWMEVRGREKTPARSLHVDIRDVAHDPSDFIKGLGEEAEGRVKSEEEFMAPYRKAGLLISPTDNAAFRQSLEDFGPDPEEPEKVNATNVARRHLERVAAYAPEFLKFVQGRKFRNPETGNQVQFNSLSDAEKVKVHAQWQGAQKAAPAEAEAGKDWSSLEVELARKHLTQVGGYSETNQQRIDDDEALRAARELRPAFPKPTEWEPIVTWLRKLDEAGAVDHKTSIKSPKADYSLRQARAAGLIDRYGKGFEATDTIALSPEGRRVLDASPETVGQKKKATMKSVDDWRFQRVGAYSPEFLKYVKSRKFRHPETGNEVAFDSLPSEEKAKAYAGWKGQEEKERAEHAIEQAEDREDISGLGHDDPRQIYAEDGWNFVKKASKTMKTLDDWSFVDKEAFLPGGPAQQPGMGQPGFGGVEEEPPLPAQVKRELAERMRDIGRVLMVSGMRAPRQQMIEIGKALNALIDQLERLADEPGRKALKRRIFLGLRNRVLGSQ